MIKTTVLNFSPKGDYSTTLQSAKYLKKHFDKLEFEFFNIGQTIKSLENNPALINNVIKSIKESELIIWLYPVYTFLPPYQLIRFIDLIYDRNLTESFSYKYGVQLSTSMHFFDNTAYNYLWNIIEDLQMKHIPGHTGFMTGLDSKQGRRLLIDFGKELVFSVENAIVFPPKFLNKTQGVKSGTLLPEPITVKQTAKSKEYKIILLTEHSAPESNLSKMIETFTNLMPYHIEKHYIDDINLTGGCLGCLNCTFEGKCIYKDNFDVFHKTELLGANLTIYAAQIKRHWFKSKWKCYDDRLFYNGHRISSMGKSVGYIISGNLSNEANLRDVLEARSEVADTYLVGITSDETPEDTYNIICDMVKRSVWALENKPLKNRSFLGVGGMKIFRDLIFVMRGLMKEDHKFYKKHKLYDFPHLQKKMIYTGILSGLLMSFKNVRKKILPQLKEVMVKKYEKIIEKY